MDATRATIGPIAFLGLGEMGLPTAARLVAAGFSVTGYDPVEAARAAFVEAGGRGVATPGEAADVAAVLTR